MKKLRNDLSGRRFGRLTVLEVDERGTRKTYYNCLCDCGNIKSVRSDGLLSGAVKSCGCWKKEQDNVNLNKSEAKKKYIAAGHKVGGTRLYQIWQNMKLRCYNPSNERYHRYGGRGITVCDEWLRSFTSFEEWALRNGYDDTLTIDRVDCDGNYGPDNCRWATQKEQANNRSTNITIEIGNTIKTIQEWCDIFRLDYKCVYQRYIRNPNIGIEKLFSK
jgi:hypothetical protein